MQGLGGASFGSGSAFPVGIDPSRVSLADFDRDGFLDLLVLSQANAWLRVFEGTGTLTFGTVLADVDLAGVTPWPQPRATSTATGTSTSPSWCAAEPGAVYKGNGTGASHLQLQRAGGPGSAGRRGRRHRP